MNVLVTVLNNLIIVEDVQFWTFTLMNENSYSSMSSSSALVK